MSDKTQTKGNIPTPSAYLAVCPPMRKVDEARCCIHPDVSNVAVVKFYREGSSQSVHLCLACVAQLAIDSMEFVRDVLDVPGVRNAIKKFDESTRIPEPKKKR